VADAAKDYLMGQDVLEGGEEEEEEGVPEQGSLELRAAIALAGDRASEAAAHHVRSFAKSPSQIVAALVGGFAACTALPHKPSCVFFPDWSVLWWLCQESRIDHLTSELGEVRALLQQLKATM
jgi:hypothetical protein